jgi:hypothetical protein
MVEQSGGLISARCEGFSSRKPPLCVAPGRPIRINQFQIDQSDPEGEAALHAAVKFVL